MRILLNASWLITLLISSFVQAETKKVFKDCPQCPEMITIPSGNFLMGTKPLASREGLSEEQRKYAGEFEEYPQHEVYHIIFHGHSRGHPERMGFCYG